MAFQADKLTRIVGVRWEDEVEFLTITASVGNNFEVAAPLGPNIFWHDLELCDPFVRLVNLTDRFRYLKKIQFLTSRGVTAQTYFRNEETDQLGWGGSVVIDPSDQAQIVFSPEYPTTTDVPFSDWMYQGVSESADVLLGIRQQAGAQDWYQQFPTQDGVTILDSDDNPVVSPLLGVPFKTGTSTQCLIKARRYTSGPICVKQPDQPGTVGFLAGTIGEEETAHSINISFDGFRPTLGEGAGLAEGRWEAIGFAVSPEQGATAVQILCQPVV